MADNAKNDIKNIDKSSQDEIASKGGKAIKENNIRGGSSNARKGNNSS